MSEKKAGRPPKYKEEYAKQAYELALLGLTDEQMAKVFFVDVRTISAWKVDHPIFSQAVNEGKDIADAQVVASLYKRATGYTQKAVKIFANPNTGAEQIIEYEERFPPETTACIFWLKNRQKAQWRDKQDHEITGTLSLTEILKKLDAEG